MKKADLQVYFHDLQKRYDNITPDPDVQRVDYQIMAHNALMVLERIVDEGLDDDQTRLEAYHSGYDQGQFDEFADRMGKEQAEKVKGELEQQKNCPYCHGDRKATPLIDDGPDFLAFDKNGSVAFADDGAITIHADVFNYCPMCRRPLNGGSQ